MMKLLHINLLTFFSLLFLSYAQQLETINLLTDLTSIVDTNPQHHHHEISSSSSSSDVGVSKIPTSELDRTRSLPSEKVDVQPEAKQTTVDPGFTELDLRQFLNRRPVHLRNRFPFPRVLRFFPRRCNHKQQEKRFFRFANPDIRFDGLNRPLPLPRPVEADQKVIGLMFRKNGQEMMDQGQGQGQGQAKAAGRSGPFAEILQHHHVPMKFPEAQEELMMFEFKQPNYHLLHRHHHHHQRHDDGGEDDDDHEEKEKMGKHHHHHHHDDDEEEKEHGFVKKIRKFLAHF